MIHVTVMTLFNTRSRIQQTIIFNYSTYNKKPLYQTRTVSGMMYVKDIDFACFYDVLSLELFRQCVIFGFSFY